MVDDNPYKKGDPITVSIISQYEELVKVCKKEGIPMVCPYCKKDITFNYDIKKVEKHLNICFAKRTPADKGRIDRELEIIRLRGEGKPVFCKYCKKDITLNYNEPKIFKHLQDCKLKLMKKDIAQRGEI